MMDKIKINFRKIRILTCLMLLMVMLEACSGCSHRNRRGRERETDRVERRESRRERHSSRGRDDDSYRKSGKGKYSEEELQSIAEGEDYDAMLDCMFARVDEMRKLKNEYFRGNLADRDAQAKSNEIDKRYEPVAKALEKADQGGYLNYRQHKRQMKLLAEYIKEFRSICERLGQDLPF